MKFIRSLGSAWRRMDLQLVSEPGDGERRLVDEGVVDALIAEEAREDATSAGWRT